MNSEHENKLEHLNTIRQHTEQELASQISSEFHIESSSRISASWLYSVSVFVCE